MGVLGKGAEKLETAYETGLMYIHLMTGVPNIQMRTSKADVSKFVAKANKDQIVGYEIEGAPKNMEYILTKLGLSRKQKLAVGLCFIREKQKKRRRIFQQLLM